MFQYGHIPMTKTTKKNKRKNGGGGDDNVDDGVSVQATQQISTGI